MTPLFLEFERVAQLHGAKVAVVTANGALSYSALLEAALDLGRALDRLGAGAGHVVALALQNDASFLVGVLGCASRGAVCLPIDATARDAEVEAISKLVRIDAVLSHEGASPPRALAELPHVTMRRGAVLVSHGAVRAPSSSSAHGCLQLTSGTTGTPKAVVVSHAAVLERPRLVRDVLGLTPDDRTLCALPLSHAHGLDCLALPTLLAGGSLRLLQPTLAYPSRVAGLIERERITFMSVLPDFYAQLLGVEGDLRSLRLPFCGSAALSVEVARAFEQKFSVRILQGYGVAEVNVIALNLVEPGAPFEFGSVGRPIAGVETRHADDGELWVRSAALASGYLGADDEQRERFVDGWFATGDLVQHDELGRLSIVGRKSTLIHVGGARVSPLAVEAALGPVSWVKEVCVTGAPDGKGTQAVVAHVVASAGAPSVEQRVIELQRAARERLPDAAVPTRFEWWDAFPKSPLGKVLRSEVALRGGR